MFSRMQLLADTDVVASRFGADQIKNQEPFLPNAEISGFAHANHPVILKKGDSDFTCENFRWGLVPPDWRKAPEEIWNHTISAKLEYLGKRYAWRKVSGNRCLIPATAYFEYHWNDPKGNSKTKYTIQNANDQLFALAGLFSIWHNPESQSLQTFAVCTTNANEAMTFVHNKDAAKNYHRMPVMLNRADERNWLDTSVSCMDFAYPNYRPDLTVKPIDDAPIQPKLF